MTTRALLIVKTVDGGGVNDSESLHLQMDTITIGRKKGWTGATSAGVRTIGHLADPSRIDIVDIDRTQTIGANHLRLHWNYELKRYEVEDLGSGEGSYLGLAEGSGVEMLNPGERKILQKKDYLLLGSKTRPGAILLIDHTYD